MAPKRPGIPTVPKVASSSVLSSVQQSKSIASPPSLVQPIIVKDLQDMMGKVISQIRAEMKEILEENNKILRQEIVLALKGVASVLEKLNSRVEEVAEKVELMEVKFESMEKEMENEILMLQYGQMEYALRIRGLGESLQGGLREMVAKDFAVILNKEKEEILGEIEKLFRVNSVVAVQKNLPRDVVIYFGKRSLRNEIIQAFYKKRFQIASQDVIILKEIPSKILRRRKEFAFLADELKKRRISFRWDVPIGMVVNYLGIRYRLNTVFQAKDFYTSVLGVCSSPSIKFKALEEKKVELQSEEPILMKIGKPQFEGSQQVEMEEQRITCATYNCKEKDQLQSELLTFMKIGKPQFEGPQQAEMEEQKTTCVTYNCKEKDQQKKVKEVSQVLVPESAGEAGFTNFWEQPLRAELQCEESILIKKGKFQSEGPQQVEMKEQRTTRATYKRKEKDQQKKEVKEASQLLVPELVGEPGLTNFLELSSRADFKAFFSRFMDKRD